MKPFQILRQSTLVCKCKCACHHFTLSRVEESFKMLLTTSLCFPDGFLKGVNGSCEGEGSAQIEVQDEES